MSYPATVTIQRPERTANWRPLLQWLLVAPHWLVLHVVLNVVASVTAIIAWVSVLATGKLPPAIAAFHATYVRYRLRTFSYMYCLTDRYPPFDFSPSTDDPGGAGVTLGISPRLEGRNRLNVLFRFIVPFAWINLAGLLALVGIMDVSLPPWVWIAELVLGAVLIPGAVYSFIAWAITAVGAFLGGLAVVFTGRWPDPLFRMAAGWVRVDARLWAYSMLLTDEYPPFSID